MRVYAIYDTVALGRVGALVCDRADGPVIRMFHEALKDPQSLGRYPADYELRYIGDIEDNCVFTPTTPYTVATGAAFVESQRPQIVNEG